MNNIVIRYNNRKSIIQFKYVNDDIFVNFIKRREMGCKRNS